MNNAKAVLSESQGRRNPVQSLSSPHAATGRTHDEIRDFFKRGDRGQYEGGAADRSSPSIPTWDVPERPQIVRTPKQQARRVAMMQVVGTIIAACLVLLVTAARLKSSNGFETQAVNPRQIDPQPAAQLPVKPGPQFLQQSKAVLAPPPAPAGVQESPAPVKVAAAASREVAVGPTSSPVSVSVPALSKVAVAAPTSHAAAKGGPTSIAREKPTLYAELSHQPAAVPTTHAATPRRAVAAFPDD